MEITRIKVGVMGSAGGHMSEEIVERCKELGRAIADAGCAILTGGCPGLQAEWRTHDRCVACAQPESACQAVRKPDGPYRYHDLHRRRLDGP